MHSASFFVLSSRWLALLLRGAGSTGPESNHHIIRHGASATANTAHDKNATNYNGIAIYNNTAKYNTTHDNNTSNENDMANYSSIANDNNAASDSSTAMDK